MAKVHKLMKTEINTLESSKTVSKMGQDNTDFTMELDMLENF